MSLPSLSPLGPVDYTSTDVPVEYHCGQCGALGVKLWREYQTFLNHQSLLCGKCACREQSKDGKSYSVSDGVDRGAGKITVTVTYGMNGFNGDRIGWRIPAVPTADGETYWDYTSVPQDGCDWWDRLPLSKAAP